MGLGNSQILLGLVLNDLQGGSGAVLCVGLINPHYWGKTYLKTLSITRQSMSFSRLADEIKALFLPYVSIALFLSLAWGRFLKWVHTDQYSAKYSRKTLWRSQGFSIYMQYSSFWYFLSANCGCFGLPWL